jgi:hypothetical protein
MATIAIIPLPLSSQQLKKPDKTKIPCPICGDLAKPGSGLTSHQRLNKRCIEKAASYISQEIVNNSNTNITSRKLNSKTKTQNSESNNTQNLAALFLN